MSADCCSMDMFQPIHMQAPPGEIPRGLKVTSLQDAQRLDSARTNPVLSIGSFTLWPMSYYDNRVSFGMVLYDPKGKVVGVLEKPGARYIVNITTSGRESEGVVTFTGQANQSVTMSCMEIDKFLKGGD
ncbi:MAG TPA: hypothetical protein VFS20_20595 [Longimicrobium sp.]|nr:hypothetical protein [Longimicrobium sp.]